MLYYYARIFFLSLLLHSQIGQAGTEDSFPDWWQSYLSKKNLSLERIVAGFKASSPDVYVTLSGQFLDLLEKEPTKINEIDLSDFALIFKKIIRESGFFSEEIFQKLERFLVNHETKVVSYLQTQEVKNISLFKGIFVKKGVPIREYMAFFKAENDLFVLPRFITNFIEQSKRVDTSTQGKALKNISTLSMYRVWFTLSLVIGDQRFSMLRMMEENLPHYESIYGRYGQVSEIIRRMLVIKSTEEEIVEDVSGLFEQLTILRTGSLEDFDYVDFKERFLKIAEYYPDEFKFASLFKAWILQTDNE